ncbi:FkbM family methyltransferase [Xylanimonas allomyrinae]|uniref:FkbM family methyltransferase n=1 Tax=Xylanimonas allomyrinae TaxID=2509459 RepID=A0A4P6ENT3_9MICO|nr:FkbM family methyltransferase [Xylanimonas allomyrinae]QAY63393.1 FkbM family methyltransferase [Xylanimonas allomyrinae]
MDTFVSYAQHGEDVILWRALGARSGITYVDVGAYDPTEESVTRALYERGWRGVNIEPQPERLAAFENDRPDDTNLAIAIGSKDGSVELVIPSNPGWTTVQGTGSLVSDDPAAHRIRVPMRRLGTLLPELGLEHVDVLKIDVECGESDAVRGLLDGPVRPTVCVIEGVGPGCGRTEGDRAVELLVAAGYTHCMFDGLNHYLTTDPALIAALSVPANPIDGYVHRAIPAFATERSHLHETIAALTAENLELRSKLATSSSEGNGAAPEEPAATSSEQTTATTAATDDAPLPVSAPAPTAASPRPAPRAAPHIVDDERARRRRALFLRLIGTRVAADAGRQPAVDIPHLFDASPESVVRTLYLSVLGREPDDSGSASWIHEIANGRSPIDVARVLARSDEAAAASESQRRRADAFIERLDRFGLLDSFGLGTFYSKGHSASVVADQIFIESLYEVAHLRRPTHAELENDLNRIRIGVGRQWMLRAFADRPEARARLLGTAGGVRTRMKRLGARMSYRRDFQTLVVAVESRRIAALLTDLSATDHSIAGGTEMRVILATTTIPHISGGDRLIVRWTAEELRARGHEVEEFYLPFPPSARYTLPALVGLRSTPFAGAGDRLIAVRWPAHILRHENKATWFIHHFRTLFDLWDSPYRDVPDNAEGYAYRDAIRRIDNLGLAESRDVFSNSNVVRDRLREYNDVEATPLLPPIGGDTTRFHTDAYGDYIFYPSRVAPIKRQLLAVEAMLYTQSGVKLVIGGLADEDYQEDIVRFVREHDLEGKVDLRLGWMPEDEKVDLLAGCLAVAYLPRDEDSYGYTSLEASHSRKAIVTVTDSGGALEFVRDGIEGRVVAPTPHALAAAFDALYEDRQAAERLGYASHDRRAALGITWDNVIPHLLGVTE